MASSAAFAQDESPGEAMVRAQQELHARQLQQLHRADVRLVNPLMGDVRTPPHPRGTPIDLPTPRDKGEGSAPWLLAVVAVAAGTAGLVVRSRRRAGDRSSQQQGHQARRR